MYFNLNYLKNMYNMNIKGIIHIGAHKKEEKYIYESIGLDSKRVIWVDGVKYDGVNYDDENGVGCDDEDYNVEAVLNYMVYDDEQYHPFHITNHEQSSSLLNLCQHSLYYPDIKVVKRDYVRTTRMDSIIGINTIDMTQFNMVVLDIQGTEINAINSFGKYIQNIDYIYTEVNFAELYKGCKLHEDINIILDNYGFVLKVVCKNDKMWGDALYIRKGLKV